MKRYTSLNEKSIPKIGDVVTVSKKRKQSSWSGGFKAGIKVKVISYDKLDDEKVLVVSTLKDIAKDDYDSDMDYHILYIDEVR